MPEHFQDAFDFAAIGMALVSTEGRWLRVNRSLCELVGYSVEELLGLTFQEITHPEDLDVDLAYVGQLLRGEIPHYQMEKRYRRKDGRLVWVLLSVSLVRARPERPPYFIAQIQDITDRKLAEHDLDLFFNLPMIFRAVIATNGRFKRLSPHWMAALGYSADQLMDRPLLDLVHPEDQGSTEAFLLGCDLQAPGRGRVPAFQNRVRRADGAFRWLMWCGISVPERGLIFTAASDITSLKDAEERALADGREKQRLIEELTHSACIIRDLRAQLVTICAWSKQIRQGDDWHSIESFLSERLGLRLTHGMSDEVASEMLLDLKAQAARGEGANELGGPAAMP